MKIKMFILTLLIAFIAAGCEAPKLPDDGEKFAYSIIIPPTAYGSVTASLAKAAEGTKITLIVSPYSGYVLKDMSVNHLEKSNETLSLSGEGSSRVFTMRASSVIVNAEFEPVTYNISIENVLNGAVTASKQTASVGEVVALSLKANQGYVLSQNGIKVISDNSASVAVNNSSLCACGLLCMCEDCKCEKFDVYFLMPASNVTISVQFVRLYTITVKSAGGEYGEIFVSHKTAIEGTPVMLTFTPNEGYRVRADNFSIKGTANGAAITSNLSTERYYIQTRTFSMPAFDVTVNIEFEEIPPGTISVYFEGFYDEEMDLSQYGNVIRRNWVDPVTGNGDIVTVTVAAGFDKYYWYLDDSLLSAAGNSVTFDSYRLQLGVYTITAVVVKDGVPYSKIVTFTVVDF